MKRFAVLAFLAFTMLRLNAQTGPDYTEGVVSFISSQNVYVKFASTEGIKVGDTLFLSSGNIKAPALIVSNLSSISCVCTPLSNRKISVSDKFYARSDKKPKADKSQDKVIVETKPATKADTSYVAKVMKPTDKTAISTKQSNSGRASVASYAGFSDTPSGNSLRMRYTLSLNAKNIADSKLSAESYVSFVHRDGQWNEIKSNIFNGLKIYNLSLSYAFNENFKVTFGRKINQRISNMGAVDGLQVEFRSGSIVTGLLAGSRPDYKDYSFNFGLMQFGGFISHELSGKNGTIQTTLAFAEQKNGGITDRRFAYIQHSNTLVKRLSIFGSAEFDLYKKVNEVQDNSPKLSNLYLSLRYRVIQPLSIALSYSARKNVVYYETYKTFIEQLLESETQQGYLLQVNVRPMKKMSVGATAGYRFMKSDPNPSKNLYAYLTYSQIPYIDVATTLSATLIKTAFLSGNVYSLNFTRDIIRGKLSGGMGYKFLDYKFLNSNASQLQHMGEISLNWRIKKKLSFSVNYEGTIDSRYMYHRIYGQLSKSF